MPTQGQALFLRQNINSFIALLFVGSFALMMGLVMWHTAFGYNPLANLLSGQAAAVDSSL